MKLGFIGTGSMGSLLIQSFIAAGVESTQIWVTNRSGEKVKKLADQHPGIHTSEENRQVAQEADLLFICVKPKEYRTVVEEIRGVCRKEQFLIVITSPIQLEWLEELVPCKLVRMIPSLNHLVHSGNSLIHFHPRCSEADRKRLLALFQLISTPLEIEEEFVRICADLSSCAPAFFSFILEQWAKAAHVETGISEEAATFLLTQSLISLGKLLEQEVFTLPTLQARVCVPGGVTGVGLEAMHPHLLPLFRQLFQATQRKHAEDVAALAPSYPTKSGDTDPNDPVNHLQSCEMKSPTTES